MKWIGNVTHPDDPRAVARIVPKVYQTRLEAHRERLAWLRGKVLGAPQAQLGWTVAQLVAANIVGVYELEDGERRPTFDDESDVA